MNLFSANTTQDKLLATQIKNIFGCKPGNIFLYKQAFRHKSRAKHIKKEVDNSNERLEYLGDAVLASVVADFLFNKFPFRDEGFLTEMRSKIVSRVQLGKIAKELGLQHMLQVDKSAVYNKGTSVCGNAYKMVIDFLHYVISYFIDNIYQFSPGCNI